MCTQHAVKFFSRTYNTDVVEHEFDFSGRLHIFTFPDRSHYATRVLDRTYDGLLSLGRTVIGYPPTFLVNASFILILTSCSFTAVCTLKLRRISDTINFIDIMAYFIPETSKPYRLEYWFSNWVPGYSTTV